MKRVWLWWSSGKDSAWTLHELRQRDDVEVTALVTTVNERFDRVAMHAVRREFLEDQARAAGLESPSRILARMRSTRPLSTARWTMRYAKVSSSWRSEIFFWKTCGATEKICFA